MHKLLSALTAGALALSLSGFAFAQQDQQSGAQQQQGAQTTNEEYQAALKKCDAGPAADKQKCIDAAKKKHGQM
jgi:hypothetical protein